MHRKKIPSKLGCRSCAAYAELGNSSRNLGKFQKKSSTRDHVRVGKVEAKLQRRSRREESKVRGSEFSIQHDSESGTQPQVEQKVDEHVKVAWLPALDMYESWVRRTARLCM